MIDALSTPVARSVYHWELIRGDCKPSRPALMSYIKKALLSLEPLGHRSGHKFQQRPRSSKEEAMQCLEKLGEMIWSITHRPDNLKRESGNPQ